MPELDKLVELITGATNGFSIYWARVIAERLLASGVVVLPCKVGTTAYYADEESGRVLEGCVDYYELLGDGAIRFEFRTYEADIRWVSVELPIEDFGKTVFLTITEAAKAMKRMEG